MNPLSYDTKFWCQSISPLDNGSYEFCGGPWLRLANAAPRRCGRGSWLEGVFPAKEDRGLPHHSTPVVPRDTILEDAALPFRFVKAGRATHRAPCHDDRSRR